MLASVLTVGIALAILALIARATGDESIGYGATLKINDGASSAFVAVPKLTKLGIPTEKTGTAESKALDLPEAVIRKLPTLKDGGTFTFSYQAIGATFDRIEVIRAARSTKQWQVSVPIDTGEIEITVEGFVEMNGLEDIEADKITVGNVTVVVSGPQIPGGASVETTTAAEPTAAATRLTAPKSGAKMGRKQVAPTI